MGHAPPRMERGLGGMEHGRGSPGRVGVGTGIGTGIGILGGAMQPREAAKPGSEQKVRTSTKRQDAVHTTTTKHVKKTSNSSRQAEHPKTSNNSKQAEHPKSKKEDYTNRKATESIEQTKTRTDDTRFVGKPDRVIHDPMRRDGKLGDLHDHKQVVIRRDDDLFIRHYYYTRLDDSLNWFWWDDRVTDPSTDIAKVKDVPYCEDEYDDNCDALPHLPPNVVEIQDNTQTSDNKQTKDNKQKKDDKQTKDDKQKKDNKQTTDNQQTNKDQKEDNEIDCVLIVQYPADPEGPGVAGNKDLEESGKLGAPTGATIRKMSTDPEKQGDLPGAVNGFTEKGKKWCNSFSLVSHEIGGAIMLPYSIEGSPKPLSLGGTAADPKTGNTPNQEHFGNFVKALKGALCKTGKPVVTFNICSGGVEGGIAEQVAAKGIATKGWDGYCEMGPVVDEDTKEKAWGPPRSNPDKPATLKSFEPTKEAQKK
jgi:hypothetical protein